EDQSGGGPSLPSTRREVVDRRLQGERQEQRDPDHRQEAAQLIDQVEEDEDRDPGGEECESEPLPGQLDRVGEPRRHRPVAALVLGTAVRLTSAAALVGGVAFTGTSCWGGLRPVIPIPSAVPSSALHGRPAGTAFAWQIRSGPPSNASTAPPEATLKPVLSS